MSVYKIIIKFCFTHLDHRISFMSKTTQPEIVKTNTDGVNTEIKKVFHSQTPLLIEMLIGFVN